MQSIRPLIRAGLVAVLGFGSTEARSQVSDPASSGVPIPNVSAAGYRSQTGSPNCCPPPCYPTLPGFSASGTPSSPGLPPSGLTNPGAAPAPGATPPATPPGMADPTASAAPAFGGREGGASSGDTAAVAMAPGGYLDIPMPISIFRLRTDAGFNMNRPDRSEYFYGAWNELSFHSHAIKNGGQFFDPQARGPVLLPGSLNYQEISPYFEYAVNPRSSISAEIPVRFVQFRNILEDQDSLKDIKAVLPGTKTPAFPEPSGVERGVSTSTSGLSDIVVGLKYAVVADPNRFVTLQYRTYLPTGDSRLGLGTGHVSLEPGLLFYQRFADRWTFQAQFKDWIPVGGSRGIDGTAFDGNILNYGLGIGYDAYNQGNLRVTPITEFVGWTVTKGLASLVGDFAANPLAAQGIVPDDHGVENVKGNTIVNAKLGVRAYYGTSQDLYLGYGHVVTGNRWYQDIVRLEYRYKF